MSMQYDQLQMYAAIHKNTGHSLKQLFNVFNIGPIQFLAEESSKYCDGYTNIICNSSQMCGNTDVEGTMQAMSLFGED